MPSDKSPKHRRPSSPRSPNLSPTMSLSSRMRRNKVDPPHLSGLPRFHPARYHPTSPGAHQHHHHHHSSSSSHRPVSPNSQALQQLSDAQKQLHVYQREIIANASRTMGGATAARSGAGASGDHRPGSPRLIPLGSPGPITPLLLEEEGGYLAAGVSHEERQAILNDESSQQQLVDRLIRTETNRRRGSQLETSPTKHPRR